MAASFLFAKASRNTPLIFELMPQSCHSPAGLKMIFPKSKGYPVRTEAFTVCILIVELLMSLDLVRLRMLFVKTHCLVSEQSENKIKNDRGKK